MSRWLRWTLLALGALVLVLVLAAGWLLGTRAGLGFVLERASGATAGAFTTGSASGRIAGPLELRDVRYRDADSGLDVRVARLRLDAALGALAGRKLLVRALELDGVVVELPAAQREAQTSASFALEPPLAIELQHGELRALELRQDGAPLFAANRIALAGAWDARGVELRQLRLEAPAGHASASGRLANRRGWPGKLDADFAWRVDEQELRGTLAATSSGRQADARLELAAPVPAQLRLAGTPRGEFPWTLELHVPETDVSHLPGGADIKRASLDLAGSGTRRGAQLHGSAVLGAWPLELETLELALDEAATRVDLHALTLRSARIPGALEAQGSVQLDAQPLAAELQASWHDVELPAALAGRELASSGTVALRGSAAAWSAQGDARLGPSQAPAQLEFELQGDAERIEVAPLRVRQERGELRVDGALELAPVLAWEAQVRAQRFDPGAFFAGWDGVIDLEAMSRGAAGAAPHATLTLQRLDGQLRDRPLDGGGELAWSAQEVLSGKLALRSGASRVRIDAAPGRTNDARLHLDIASLGDWLPGASGRVDATARLRGGREALALDARVDGSELRQDALGIDVLGVDVQLSDLLGAPAGTLALEAQELVAGDLHVNALQLDGEGDLARHGFRLAARGPHAALSLRAAGGVRDAEWTGTVDELELSPHGMPPWRLADAASLRAGSAGFALRDFCLSAGDPRLCVSAQQDAAGLLDLDYSITALPLELLASLVPQDALDVVVRGDIAGSGRLQRAADGRLGGSAELALGAGSVALADAPDDAVLGWEHIAAQAELDGADQRLTLAGELTHEGRLDGAVRLTGSQQALAGELHLELGSLAFTELLSRDLAAVQGTLAARLVIAGTLAAPQLGGAARVSDFAAEVPALGLQLHDGRFSVDLDETGKAQLAGELASGDGRLELQGEAALDGAGETWISARGERFTLAGIPAARLVASPTLIVRHDAAGLNIGGLVRIDRADVDLGKLPGGGSARASPDVVIVDAPESARADELPLTANIAIDLGEQARLVGLGLDGRLGGRLTVQQRPGRSPIAHGQVQVSGTYRAYGQDLRIKRGQLLFASTPLDNPGLDIRAVRSLTPTATIDEGQEVGLQISGTATRPQLTVFSNPMMSQADALSYLVTGKPLSEVQGGEGNLVGAAAQALGSATGDLLAKSVGSRIGVDDIGVASNDALGGGAAFTVGKYLSPRLYLNYGVGLFDPGTVITLRYFLSQRWNFEAIQATEFSRAAFNYRYEK